MTGVEFEKYWGEVFEINGYQIKFTKGSGDQGGDLLVWKRESEKLLIQAKCWSVPVGNGAVQEVLGGLLYYGCGRGIVVSASGFSRAARALAKKAPHVELWDKERIRRFLRDSQR
jgi:restriction system protein